MAAALEGGLEENPYHLFRHSRTGGPRADAEYVGVVVASRHFGGKGIVAQGGS